MTSVSASHILLKQTRGGEGGRERQMEREIDTERERGSEGNLGYNIWLK